MVFNDRESRQLLAGFFGDDIIPIYWRLILEFDNLFQDGEYYYYQNNWDKVLKRFQQCFYLIGNTFSQSEKEELENFLTLWLHHPGRRLALDIQNQLLIVEQCLSPTTEEKKKKVGRKLLQSGLLKNIFQQTDELIGHYPAAREKGERLKSRIRQIWKDQAGVRPENWNYYAGLPECVQCAQEILQIFAPPADRITRYYKWFQLRDRQSRDLIDSKLLPGLDTVVQIMVKPPSQQAGGVSLGAEKAPVSRLNSEEFIKIMKAEAGRYDLWP
jgi:hypothetical protein